MNIGWIARGYRWIEYLAFGRALERCRFVHLEFLPNLHSILLLGEGDGRFLARLASLQPDACFDVVDNSHEMVALASSRLTASQRIRVQFHALDARSAALPETSYDLVATNFVLDCFDEVEAARVVARVSNHVRSGGLWLVSEFQQPRGGIRHLHATLWIRAMYLFFRATTGLRVNRVPAYGLMLTDAGFKLARETRWRWGLIVSQLWLKTTLR